MIVVVGLGQIGAGLGLRLVDQGRSVLGFDLDPERRRQWSAETGSSAAESLQHVPWADVQHVVVAVRLPDQAHALLHDLRQLAGQLPLGVLVVTTMTVAAARNLARYEDTAWRVFEAPVSGGQAAVRNRRLTCLLAGPEPISSDSAVIAALTERCHRFPMYGQPATAKLLNNALASHHLRSLAQTMMTAVQEGLEPSAFLAVVGSSSGQSFAGDRLLAFTENELALLAKDARLAAESWPELPAVQRCEGMLDVVHAAQSLARDV